MLGRARPYFRGLKSLAARPLVALGVRPNLISAAAVPIAILAAYWCTEQRFLLAGFVAIFASLFDFVDGEVARQQGCASPWGNYFETIADRLVETSLLLGLVGYQPRLAGLALALAFLVSYSKARVGLVIITDNRDWPGMGDHSDRMVLIVAAIFFAGHSWLCSLALISLCAMTLIGFGQRLRYAKRLIESAESEGQILPYLRE